MNKSSRLLFALAILVLIGAYFAFDLGRFFGLDYIKAQQSVIEAWRAASSCPASQARFASSGRPSASTATWPLASRV